ncbi:MAG: TonB-dependent receptor [Prevotellaceae bacterium]|jgi:TonB-linked SusC/RagA family outer membrane protein|nr:TonB-dependent receptor [Prevotellaceae bacterium]
MKHKSSKNLRLRLKTVAVSVLLGFGVTFAQNVTVQGTVSDQSGENLIGVSIAVQGTTTGTITDVSGKYSISATVGQNLVFSYVGYLSQTIKVGTQRTVNIVLQEDQKMLDEVVAVGYGVQKKSDITGAIAQISTKELSSKPVSNAFEALQGKVAGVDITNDQRPGELGSILIRGKRSITGGNAPLYVVDGMVLTGGSIETLNPDDIETVSVLKDASATAIYGSRGANGVVLVTTKRGKAGKFQLNYSGSFTTENIHDLSPSMDINEYATWRRWAFHNSNPSLYSAGNQPTQAQDAIYFEGEPTALNNIMKGWSGGSWDASKVTNTDWTDFVTQTGITQTHTVSASGGTDRMKSFVSIGYLNNEGTQKGQAYERYNLALSTDITATKWFTMGGSINASLGNQSYGFSRTGQSTGTGPTDIYNAAKQIFNYALPYDADNNLLQYPAGTKYGGMYNVVDEWTKSLEKRQTVRAMGSFYGDIDFEKLWSPLQGLKYKISFGPDLRFYRRGFYVDDTSVVRMGGLNRAMWNYSRTLNWVINNVLSYAKDLGQHKFDVMLLQEASKYDEETASMSAFGIPKDSYLWNNMGSVNITSSDTQASMGTDLRGQRQLVSFGGRANYAFNDKYLLTVSGRYDGSSVLATGHKWHFFPSAALGWRMEEEDFIKNIEWIQQLKLRAGVGTTGNSAIDPYSTLGLIQSFYVPFGGEQSSLAYATNEPYYTSTQLELANKQLTWESTTSYNFAVDFSLFKGRINGSLDVYNTNTSDLLLPMSIPTLTGYARTTANIGKTKGSGVDVTLNFVPVKTHGFEWNSTLNTSYNKEEIVELSNGKNDMVDNTLFIGQSIDVYYGYQNAGLWQESDATAMAAFTKEHFTAGNVRPVEQKVDSEINADDRTVLGNRNPRWILGWSNTFSWKGLELNVELFGRMGYMISTGGEIQNGVNNQRQLDYWTPDNTDAEWQKPVWTGTAGSSGDPYATLLGFKKASFVKFRNISLGYYLPQPICTKLQINSVKVYAQLRNPGNLYSSVDFFDLDANSSYYNRGITFGLQVGF